MFHGVSPPIVRRRLICLYSEKFRVGPSNTYVLRPYPGLANDNSLPVIPPSSPLLFFLLSINLSIPVPPSHLTPSRPPPSPPPPPLPPPWPLPHSSRGRPASLSAAPSRHPGCQQRVLALTSAFISFIYPPDMSPPPFPCPQATQGRLQPLDWSGRAWSPLMSPPSSLGLSPCGKGAPTFPTLLLFLCVIHL